jgi:hypothetical protein
VVDILETSYEVRAINVGLTEVIVTWRRTVRPPNSDKEYHSTETVVYVAVREPEGVA